MLKREQLSKHFWRTQGENEGYQARNKCEYKGSWRQNENHLQMKVEKFFGNCVADNLYKTSTIQKHTWKNNDNLEMEALIVGNQIRGFTKATLTKELEKGHPVEEFQQFEWTLSKVMSKKQESVKSVGSKTVKRK